MVPGPEFCAESENAFLTNGRWWVCDFGTILYVNMHNVSFYEINRENVKFCYWFCCCTFPSVFVLDTNG